VLFRTIVSPRATMPLVVNDSRNSLESIPSNLDTETRECYLLVKCNGGLMTF
jgi:hypothetical protein